MSGAAHRTHLVRVSAQTFLKTCSLDLVFGAASRTTLDMFGNFIEQYFQTLNAWVFSRPHRTYLVQHRTPPVSIDAVHTGLIYAPVKLVL